VRLRTSAAAVLAAVLATATLAGCRTNVGVAARVNGQRITETQVEDYLTPKAAPVSSQTQSGTALKIAPRTIVLTVLVKERLYRALLAKTPSGSPSEGQLMTLVSRSRQGKSYQQAASALGVKGYTTAFAKHLLTYAELGNLLNAAVQSGVDVNKIASKLKFPVSVSARYGTWDKKTFSVVPDSSAGVPTFVTLQPTASTGTSAAPAN
jgi:hypothetical protein